VGREDDEGGAEMGDAGLVSIGVLAVVGGQEVEAEGIKVEDEDKDGQDDDAEESDEFDEWGFS
jgi:hypothetical protein